jgi:hypothetical protein
MAAGGRWLTPFLSCGLIAFTGNANSCYHQHHQVNRTSQNYPLHHTSKKLFAVLLVVFNKIKW